MLCLIDLVIKQLLSLGVLVVLLRVFHALQVVVPTAQVRVPLVINAVVEVCSTLPRCGAVGTVM